MKTLSRQEIFAKAAKKLRQDFRELSETVPHNAVKGQEAVKLVKEFLAGHLPKRFALPTSMLAIKPTAAASKTSSK